MMNRQLLSFMLIFMACVCQPALGQSFTGESAFSGLNKVRLSNGEITSRHVSSDSVIEVLDDSNAPFNAGIQGERAVAVPARTSMQEGPQKSQRLSVNRRATTYDAQDYTGTLTCRAVEENGSSVNEQRTYTITVSVGSYDDLSNVPVTFKNMYGFATITAILDYSNRTFYMPSLQNVTPGLLLYVCNEDGIYSLGDYYLTGRLSSDGTTIIMDGYGGRNGFYLRGNTTYKYFNNVITLPKPIEINGVYPPVINPGSGQFAGTQDITISSATEDAVIEYQIDDDGEWQTLENGGTITIDQSCKITAYALLGEENSATRSATYTKIIPNEFALSEDELAALNFQTNYAFIDGELQLVDQANSVSVSYTDLTREELYIRTFWGYGLVEATVNWTSPGEGVISILAQHFMTYNRYNTSWKRYDWYVIAPTSINDGVVREYDDFAYNDDYVVVGTINKNELWINDYCIMAVCGFVNQTNTSHGPVYGNSILRTKISASQATHKFRDSNEQERSYRIAIEQDLTHQQDETSPRVYTKVVGLNGYSGETTICTYLPENSSELVEGYDNIIKIEVVESPSARYFLPAYPYDVKNSKWYNFQYQDTLGNNIAGAYSNSNKIFTWSQGRLSSNIGILEKATENRIIVDDDVDAYGVGKGAFSPAIRESNIRLSSSTDTWNDSIIAKEFVLSGTYFSIANRPGTIYYAVSTGDWQPSGLNLNSGEAFSLKVPIQFPDKESVHTVRLAACDSEGLYSKFQEAEFYDVKYFEASGVYNRNFTSRPVELPELSFTNKSTGETLTEGTHYKLTYRNNRNAGTASIAINGIYPYSVGNDTIHFEISPAVLDAEVSFEKDNYAYSKDGSSIIPNLQVVDKIFGVVEPEDYTLQFSNNIYPGEATVAVTAQRNYIGEATGSFEITRADVLAEDFTCEATGQSLYDGNPKQVTVHSDYANFPEATFIYHDKGSNEEVSPVEPGEYDVDIVFAQNRCYNAARFNNVTSVVCKLLNDDDWEILKQFHNTTNGNEWKNAWDMSDRRNAGSLYGLTFDDDRVATINESNQQLSGTFPAMLLSLDKLQSLNLSHNNLSGDPYEAIAAYRDNNKGRLKYLNVSYNNLSGNVGSFANALSGLETLIANDNHFREVSPVIPLSITTLNLSNQTLSDVVALTTGDLVGYDLIDMLPTIVTYNHENQSYAVPQLTVSEQTANDGFSMTYNNQRWSFSSDYKGENGQTLDLKSRYCTMPISFNFNIGDANFDGEVSVLDLQSIINKIFGRYNYNFNWTAGNVIVDERLNVQDVVGEVNMLLAAESNGIGKRVASRNTDALMRTPKADAEALLFWREGILYLSSRRPVAALDIMLDGGVTWDVARHGLVASTKENHIVAYSLNGSTIPAGETAIATATGVTPVVLDAMLSDAEAQEIELTIGESGIVTGVTDINRGDITVTVADGGRVVLNAAQSLNEAQWAVYSINGDMIAVGSESLLAAGEKTLAHGLDAGVYIVKVTARNLPTFVTKIAIIR